MWLQWLLVRRAGARLDGDLPAPDLRKLRRTLPAIKSGPAGDTLTLPTVLPPGESCRLEYRGCSWSAINGGSTVIAAGSRAHIDRVDGLDPDRARFIKQENLVDIPLGYGVIAIAVLAVIVVMKTATVVPQQSAFVVEYLGKYSRTLQAGFHILIPFVEKIAYRHSLKEIAIDIAEQICITRDNVQVGVDAVLYMQVLDPHLASYGITNYGFAISQLAQTTLRSEIGKIELDRTFEARGQINTNVVSELDKASAAWGVKVLRYEIKNITPPKDVLSAMEKQMRAEREKRAVVLTSEGERDAKINAAEGDKQRVIKQSEANKQQQINEAEGQAAAILAVATATAEGLRQVGIALSDRGGIEAMQLRIGEEYVKQFGKLAQTGTTLVVPANLTDLASIVTMATSIARKPPAHFLTLLTKIGFTEFVVLAAAMMSTQAIAIDAMLPAFPVIGHALAIANENHVQWIITAYMAGMGCGQLFWGLMSDRFGRRPILLGGLSLYVLAALLCGLAGSFHALLAWRFVHGLAAASVVVTRSVVRDLYSGRSNGARHVADFHGVPDGSHSRPEPGRAHSHGSALALHIHRLRNIRGHRGRVGHGCGCRKPCTRNTA